MGYFNAKSGLEELTEKGLKNNVHMALEIIDMHNVGKAFQTITDSINGITAQMEEISTKVQKMNEGAGHLVQSIAETEKLSQATAGYAQNVASATEEQTASMEEIAAATQMLGQMAGELQNTVDGFKLS